MILDKDILNYQDKFHNTILMSACEHGLQNIALELIGRYKMECLPDKVNIYKLNAFQLACIHDLPSVCLMLINTMGISCLPKYTNQSCDHAGYSNIILESVFYAWHHEMKCKKKNINFCDAEFYKCKFDVATNLLQVFGRDCLAAYPNNEAFKIIIMSCRNDWTPLALSVIDIFGKDCLHYEDACFGYILSIACMHKREKIAIKLLEQFGTECNIGKINSQDMTAWEYAKKNGMTSVMELIKKFS